MVTDSSAEARKVDKRTAQALWDSAVIPSGLRKKKQDSGDSEEDVSDAEEAGSQGTMKFVLLTKKGNKQQVQDQHSRTCATLTGNRFEPR